MQLSIGEEFELFYNERNINNMAIEIRAIVDEAYVVFKTSKGHYKMESLSYFKMLHKHKILIKKEPGN